MKIKKIMTIGENKVVSMTYTLKEENENGNLIQEVDKNRPFVYLFNMGGLLPAFKANLQGLKVGDNFSFILKKEDAYGIPEEENVIRLDKQIFEIDGKFDDANIRPGALVPMEDEQGFPLTGRILEVADEGVLVDFNHPLAGLDLYFEGEILDVREATVEEIAHGHAHGPEGHHHH
jgi:FKBP-type peptidyl-prolyl cis-trans isomerase SlyD